MFDLGCSFALNFVRADVQSLTLARVGNYE
jgi:hypothetical protein